ncbi:MAG: hypothetical protein K5866_03850 [Treponema sp.]|nr:hypothetical protein [Treponema sp.]
MVTGQTAEQKERRQADYEYRKQHSRDYICKYCGCGGYSVRDLTSGQCNKSPTGYHVPY